MQLPEKFLKRLDEQFRNQSSELKESFSLPPATSIRIHPNKLKSYSAEKIPWSEFGFYLKERPLFTIDPLLHAGCYYVQEASSMFMEQVFTQLFSENEKIIVLDLCAAPGGKSTHIASLLNSKSVLVSNEIIQSRIPVLKENIIKQGTGNIMITNSDAKNFGALNEVFDCIVLDAPCSGEGLFRKDKRAISEWSEENAHHCSIRQKRILDDVLPCLRQNGLLIYSTCTFNPEENEMQLKWLKESFGFTGVRLKIDRDWNIDEWNEDDLYAYRFLPNKLKGEGFFLSVMRKTESNNFSETVYDSKTDYANLPKKYSQAFFQNAVLINENENIYEWKKKIFLLNTAQIELLKIIGSDIKIIYAGIELGEIKQNQEIPSEALALFDRVNISNFNTVSLTTEQALSFLRKDAFNISRIEKGWLLAQYENHPLGWLKSLGNRMNNYFPTEWRIRNY